MTTFKSSHDALKCLYFSLTKFSENIFPHNEIRLTAPRVNRKKNLYGFNVDFGQPPRINSFYLILWWFNMQSNHELSLMILIFSNMRCVSWGFEWELNNFTLHHVSISHNFFKCILKGLAKACNEVLRPSFYAHKYQMILCLHPFWKTFCSTAATYFACKRLSFLDVFLSSSYKPYVEMFEDVFRALLAISIDWWNFCCEMIMRTIIWIKLF